MSKKTIVLYYIYIISYGYNDDDDAYDELCSCFNKNE